MSSTSSKSSSSSPTMVFMQEEAGMEVEEILDMVNKEKVVEEEEGDDEVEVGPALLRRNMKVVLGNGNFPVAEIDQEEDGSEHQKNVYFDQEQGIWKCHHCSWTCRDSNVFVDHFQNFEGYFHGDVDVKTSSKYDLSCDSHKKGTESINDVFAVEGEKNVRNEEEEEEEEEEDFTTFSRTIVHNQVGMMYPESSEYEIQSCFPVSPESSHVNGRKSATKAPYPTTQIEGTKEMQEMDVERVLAEQNTHDLFCPNCKSCITKRVIVRKRKRVIREKIEERPEKIQTVQLEVPAAAAASPTEGQDTEEVFRCLSCLSFFIPAEGGFKLFNPFEKRERNASPQLEQSENTSWFSSLFGSTTSKKKVNEPDAGNKVQQVRIGEVIKDPGQSKPVIADEKAELNVTNARQEIPILSTSRDVSKATAIEVKGHYENGKECDSSGISPPDDIIQQVGPKPINIFNPYLFRMKMSQQKVIDEKSEPHVLDDKEDIAVFEDLPVENLKDKLEKDSRLNTNRIADDIIWPVDKNKTSLFNPYLFRMKKTRNLKNNEGDDLVPPQQDIVLPETAEIQKLDYIHGSAAEPISSPTEVTIPIPLEPSPLDEPLIVHIQESTREPGARHEWDVLKAIVYGGLIESITSLSVVSSAGGADASTLNIVALGMANLLGGLLILINNLMELNDEEYESLDQKDERASRYWKLLGRRNHFKLHAFVAILTYIIVGVLPPAIYGFSFMKSDNKEYKLIAIAVASLICTGLLAIGKAHVQRPPKPYVKTLLYYIVLGFLASGISFVAGVWIQKLLVMVGVFDNGGEVVPSPPSLQMIQLDSRHFAWKGF